MQSLYDLLSDRRSIRHYEDRDIPDEIISKIVDTGILAPSSRNIRPVHFVVVKDKEKLAALSKCNVTGGSLIKGANAAIVVVADTSKADAWIEDCSVAMTNMMLMATDLGIGSCWVQVRLRKSMSGKPGGEVVRDVIKLPDGFEAEAILSLGYTTVVKDPVKVDDEKRKEVVHREKF
jgi:nitroreductase